VAVTINKRDKNNFLILSTRLQQLACKVNHFFLFFILSFFYFSIFSYLCGVKLKL